MIEHPHFTITLIAAPRECPKCAECEAIVQRLTEAFPGQIHHQRYIAGEPEAERFGVVMPPMLLLDDFVVSAGSVPGEDAVRELVAERLRRRAASEVTS